MIHKKKSPIKYLYLFPIFCLLGIFKSYPTQSQSKESCLHNIYTAYIQGKINVWEQNVLILDQLLNIREASIDILYQQALSEYGLVAYFLSTKQKNKAEKYLEMTERHCQHLIALKNNCAEYYALKSALFGYRTALAPYKAIFYGPKSVDALEKGFALNKNSPPVWLEKGNSLYFRPKIFGGNKEEAIHCYSIAIKLFETMLSKDISINNWLYLNTLVSLARAYESVENYQEAKNVYEKILKREPLFLWVSKELYPMCLKKIINRS